MKKMFIAMMAAVCCTFAAAGSAPKGWTTDFDAALKQAGAEKKNVLILFTGSDWCSWCKILRNNVLDNKSFERYAEKNLVLVYFDFPHSKKIDHRQMGIQQATAKRFNIQGFPTAVVVDHNGKKLLEISGYLPVEKYIERLQTIENKGK